MMKTADCISEISKCVRCGSCKAFCPTYGEDLTEPMSARGRLILLKAYLTHELGPSPLLNERIFSCILCGVCESLCPPRVDITGSLYHGRALLQASDPRRKYLRMLVRTALRRPLVAHRIARALQQIPLPSSWRAKAIPFSFPVPSRPLRGDQQVYKPERKIGRVALFAGCSVNFLFPHLGISLINVLLRLGYEVILPKGEVCCGAPLRGLGLGDEAVETARRNHLLFSRLNTEAIISLCPTCVVSLRNHYPDLIGKRLDAVMDVSSFLYEKLRSLPPCPPGSVAVTYHDPCHLTHSLGVRKEPRWLIGHAGARLIESEEKDCCGFGGIFSLQYREASLNLLAKRTAAYIGTGADAVVTACPGCMLHLSRGLREKQVFHVIELVEEAIC